jgi:LPS O-antigen subunit length determinant protein (WzzB/FepE family)
MKFDNYFLSKLKYKMNNLRDMNYDDQIATREIFISLWRGKFLIFISVVVAILGALAYLQIAEKKYTVIYKLKQVAQESATPNMGAFSGFASLAGIQLPTSTGTDFNVFKELVFSNETSQEIIYNEGLIKKLFHKEWNDKLSKYNEPSKSKKNEIIAIIKKFLNGGKERIYLPPNSKRLAKFISKNILMSEDKSTGFLTFKSETSTPENMISLILEITNVSDEIMRNRYIKFSKEPLKFYKEKLSSSRSREHREALAQLISKEEQKLMLASSSKYFAVGPIMAPSISLYPTNPRPKMILFLALIFGTFVGVVFILVRKVISKGIL